MTGPQIHTLPVLPFGSHATNAFDRVPLAYAITLRWRWPSGAGPWLVVERTYRPEGAAGNPPDTERISDGGVVRVRAVDEARARRDAARLTAALKRGLYWTRYEVVHESAVSCQESGSQFGCVT